LRRRKFDSGSTNRTLPFGAQLASISKHSAIAQRFNFGEFLFHALG
jgi:hypothetical protein